MFLLILFDFYFRLNLHQVDADVTFFGFAHKPSGAECTEDKASQFASVCVCVRVCVLLCVNFGDSDLYTWVRSLRKSKEKESSQQPNHNQAETPSAFL